ncbi:MAG TPA: PAS domain S-box protein [Methylophilaceae bacterium]|nr:PAS domain S-box protein [Methylophilaceae bacterium]
MKRLTFFSRFLMPLLLVGVLAVLSTAIYMFSLNMQNIKNNAFNETNKIANLLEMAKSLVGEHVYSSMELLKHNSAIKGKPSINGTISLNNEIIPNLMLGNESQTKNEEIVDGVTSIGNGTATLFVKNNNEFIRIATNVRTKTNTRAIGTRLDPKGKAIKQLIMGKPFYGIVDILGDPYISGYEPILDQGGNVIGAWYVGYKVDVQAIDLAIKKWGYLKTGFVAITDYNHSIRFISEHFSNAKGAKILEYKPKDWIIANKIIPDWNFEVHIAYPAKEAYLISIGNLYPILLLGSLFGFALFIIAQHAIKRFVLAPLGGDPEYASALVSRIKQGDFSDDGVRAAPNTLIDNMLKMRKHLREMVTEIKNNADRLSVSSSVFQHAHDGIFITDSEAKIIEVNPAFTSITGYSREESISKTPETLGFAYQIDAFFSQFFESTDHQGEWRGEIWNLRKNGEVYTAWLDIFPVSDESGVFQHYVGVFSDITLAKEQQKSLEFLAYHDSLTHLPNRALFSNQLQKSLSSAKRNKEMIAICYLDLDNFKPINDEYGHEVGDQLLILLAERLSKNLRKNDTLARLGGDEFAILLNGQRGENEFSNTLDRILSSIETPFIISNQTMCVSASIGYTIYPIDDNPPDTLLRHADHAMYHAKTHGGKHYHLFDLELAKLFRNQLQIKDDIAEALASQQLRMYYQPQINIRTGEVIGMEALIRWQLPSRKLLLPSEFLPFIEHTQQIVTLSEWIIDTVLKQIALWQHEGLNFHVAINIAAQHLSDKRFVSSLERILNTYPEVSPDKLNFEITESAAIGDIKNVTRIINDCKKLGVTFAIDDFGAGYSSLTYLRRLPVDMIKIDRSFIHGMLNDADDLAVVSSIITLCREFNRGVIAEGIESIEQGTKLIDLGCDFAQGHGIAKPMPANKVAKWVQSNSPFRF